MSGELEIELGSASTSVCEQGVHTSHTLRGFVSRDGEAYAVYFAGFTEGHQPVEGTLIVSIGDWTEGATPTDRTAVIMLARWIDGSPQVMVVGPEDNPWGDVGVLGPVLTRQAALARDDIKDYFHVVDHVFLSDERFTSYLSSAG